jgi:hypothetical protein
MPIAVSLRFDDDLADMLRERAELERCSINRLVNVGMRDYLKRKSSTRDAAPSETTHRILAALPAHLSALADAIAIGRQETQADFNKKVIEAFQEVKTTIALLAAALDPSTIPDVAETHAKVHA